MSGSLGRDGDVQSIRLVVGANLRRRKGEILLVALSIAAATMTLATAIPILLGVSRSIDVTFDKLHASQLLMVFDTRTVNPASTTRWWSQRPGTIAVTKTMPTKPIWGGFWHKDRHIDQSLILFERPLDGEENDRLVFIEGKKAPVPESGTIWLTNTLANGNHISVGDRIQIPVIQGIHEFRVAAIVVDADYSSERNRARACLGGCPATSPCCSRWNNSIRRQSASASVTPSRFDRTGTLS